MGIGDGFIPALIDMSFLDAVECVSTAVATAEANRIRHEYGYCLSLTGTKAHFSRCDHSPLLYQTNSRSACVSAPPSSSLRESIFR